MADQIFPQAFVEQFNANVQHLATRQNHVFAGKGIRLESNSAAVQYFDQIEGRKMRKLTSRLADTTYANSVYWRRKVVCTPYGDATIFDHADKARGIINPESIDAKNMAFAYNAAKDDIIVESALGTSVKKGESEDDPDVLVPFPASQKVPVDYGTTGTNTGLTLDKVVQIKSLISRDEVGDKLKKYFVHDQIMLDQLLKDALEIKSADYNGVKALVDGRVTYFMGMEWIKLEGLPTTGDIRTCFAYVENAVILSTQAGRGLRPSIKEHPTKWEAVEVKALADMGGTRMREDWVSLAAVDITK